MSHITIIEDIQNLPHYREYRCGNCGHQQKAFVLMIQKECEKCGVRGKLRGFAAIGTEVEDVIDTVLDWLGDGVEFEDAMKWKRVIDSAEE